MSVPSAYELQNYLSQTDLTQVAISAEVDKEGNLKPIGELFQKLAASARSGMEVGVPRIVILSDKQKDIPPEFLSEDSAVTVIQAPTLADAIQRLAYEQGAYLAVRECELHQHERYERLDPTISRPDYFEHHYQELPLLLAREAGASPEAPATEIPFLDLLAWEEKVRQRPRSYESFTLAQALARFQPRPTRDGRKEAEKAAARPIRMAIIGQPGSGKTMFEHFLARRAAETTDGRPALFPRLLLPIRVRLRDWKAWIEEEKHGKFGLPDYLAHYYEKIGNVNPRPSVEQIRTWLNRGETLMLYDGLDEIEDTGDFLTRGLKVALHAYSRCHIVLSCRTPTFERYHRSLCHDFDVYLLGPLSREQRNAYIERYLFESKDFDRFALIGRLDRSKQLQPLVTNPLILAVVCMVADKERGGALPDTRSELYDRAIYHLLRRHEKELTREREMELDRIRGILERAALKLFEHVGGRQLLFEEQTLTNLLPAATNEEKADLLDVFETKSGLLRRDADERRYYFLHLTFHEYLAACGLAAEPARAAERLLDYLTNPRWREVVLMTLGQLSRDSPTERWKNWLMDFLQAPDLLGGELAPRAALLFAEALPELKHLPEQAVENAAQLLLRAQTACEASPSYAGLRAEIAGAVEHLGGCRYRHKVERVLVQGLQDTAERAEKLAAASLVPHLPSDTCTRAVAEALDNVQEDDSADWNWPIDAALRYLAEQKPGLFFDRRDWLSQKLLRNPELARRFVSDPAWLRLGIAVYGGLRVVKTEEGNAVGYQIDRMHRDSPLTRLVVDALNDEQPPLSLVPRLKEWCRTGTMAQRVDAFLGLAALGELGADESKIRQLGVDDLKPHLERVARSLDAILPDLAKPILLSLAQLREHCSLPRWHDLLVATLSLLQREQPISHGLIRGTLLMDDPVVLAEFWNAVLTNPGRDPRHDAAVVLGTRLAQYLVETLAAYAGRVPIRWDRRPGAAFDDLPLAKHELRDKLIVALEVLDTIPDLFDFVRGNWAIPEMFSTLAGSGFAPEAVLILRNTPIDERYVENDIRTPLDEKVAPIDPLAKSLFEAEPGEHPQLVADIEDPYLRFRCYKRLLQFHPAWRSQLIGSPRITPGVLTQLWQRLFWRRVPLNADEQVGPAVQAAEAIRDPEERARAFTELAALDDNTSASRWQARARRAIGKISDPIGKVIALVRLARWSPPAEQRRLRLEACRFLSAIEQRTRAELLALLRKEFGLFTGEPGTGGRASLPKRWLERFRGYRSGFVVGRFFKSSLPKGRFFKSSYNKERYTKVENALDTAATLQDPWHRSLASGQWGPWYLHHEADFNSPEAAAVLGLRALLADLERVSGGSNNPEHLWHLLATSQRPAALATLVRKGEEEGLVLTAEAAAVLDGLYQRGERETVRRLLPLMDGTVTAAVPVLTTWLATDDAEIRRHASLLLAELEGLSARTVAGLLEWLVQPQDRCTHRAIAALLFGRSYSDPAMNTSQIGLNGLMTLARECERYRQEMNEQLAHQIWRVIERLVHDDPDLIRLLVKNVAQPGPDTDASALILRFIIFLHEKTWPAFHEALRCEVLTVRSAVMRSLVMLLARNRVDDAQWAEMVPTLLRLSPELLREWVFDPDPPDTFHADSPGALVTAAERVLAEEPVRKRPALRAEELLIQAQRSLADSWPCDEEEMRTVLTMLGKMRWSTEFNDLVQAAALRVEQSPKVFEVLIDWLDGALTETVRDRLTCSNPIGSLLGVVAAAAEALPERFYQRASRHGGLPSNLRRAVEQHNSFTGRAAALHLLSHLRRVTADSLPALKAGLRDAAEVQAAALQSVRRYRDIEPGLVKELCLGLDDESPVVAYATAQLLAALTRNEDLLSDDRRAILEALKEAAKKASESPRPVHLLIGDGDYLRIEFIGRLDQILHHLFIRLSTSAPQGEKA